MVVGIVGETAVREDSGEADDTEGVTGDGSKRDAVDRAEWVTVGVEIGGRAEAAEPVPEAEAGREGEAEEADEAEAEPAVERDAGGPAAEWEEEE